MQDRLIDYTKIEPEPPKPQLPPVPESEKRGGYGRRKDSRSPRDEKRRNPRRPGGRR